MDNGDGEVCVLEGRGRSSGAKSRAASAGHPQDFPLRLVSNIPRGGPCVTLQENRIRIGSFKAANARTIFVCPVV